MKSKTLRMTVYAALALAGMATMAEAIIGRPLTPMSYAGVARRTTYRAADDVAVAGAAMGASAAAAYNTEAYNAAVAAAPPAASCVPPAYPSTAYNAYGQAYTVCR